MLLSLEQGDTVASRGVLATEPKRISQQPISSGPVDAWWSTSVSQCVCVCACIESPSNPKLQPTKLTPFQTISGFNYIVYIKLYI